MCVIEFDDLIDINHDRTPLLYKLREINPLFKATVYAIPGLCSVEFIKSLPDWLEVAVHGWNHTSRECEFWTESDMDLLLTQPGLKHFVKGFKAPHYVISDGCYKSLLKHDFWISDIPENNHRRPVGLRYYINGFWTRADNNWWYGHIANTAYKDNKGIVRHDGIRETFDKLVERIKFETQFKFVSESLTT